MRTAMPIKIDLVAELQAALTDPDVRAVLTTYIKQAVKDALAERDTDTWLDHRAAAELLGLTVPAFVAKRRRYTELDQMSAGNGRMRRWRRADLEHWLREHGRVSRRRSTHPTSFFGRDPDRE
jgi:hypothetical protein